MSISDHENLPTAMSDSDNSPEIKPSPMSVSSSDVDEPPSKRGRTDINQEWLQQVAVTGSTQENPTNIATPLQENPIDIAGPSQLTPPPFSFVCSLKQARHLKFAIEALCDPLHNKPIGSGRIDVDVNGFHVTVENKNTNVISHLLLKPSHFELNKPIQGKTVNLRALYMRNELTQLQDDRPLDIFSVDGSNNLSFCTGTMSTTEDPVNLLENNDEIPKFPDLSFISCAVVPSKDLRSILEHLLRQVPHEVFVEITENTARLTVRRENSWTAKVTTEMPYMCLEKASDMDTTYEVNKGELQCKFGGRREVEPEKSYCASFQWGNAESLNKATDMDSTLEVSLHTTERPKYIVLRFFLGRDGYLEYVREPTS